MSSRCWVSDMSRQITHSLIINYIINPHGLYCSGEIHGNATHALKSYKCLLHQVRMGMVVISSTGGQEELGASENIERGQ